MYIQALKQAASCLKEHDLLFMEYPHEVTSQAVQVMDLASWIASQLPRDIDVIIGHAWAESLPCSWYMMLVCR